jgi:hypothetical protein
VTTARDHSRMVSGVSAEPAVSATELGISRARARVGAPSEETGNPETAPAHDYAPHTEEARPHPSQSGRALSESPAGDTDTDHNTEPSPGRLTTLRTKIGGHATTVVEVTGRGLDAAAPAAAPLADWWSREAARRVEARTAEHRKELRDARTELRKTRAERKTAETAVTAARKTEGIFGPTTRAARAERRATRAAADSAATRARMARKNYPATLPRVVATAHAGHTAGTGVLSAAMTSPWPLTASAVTIASFYASLWLGSREPSARAELGELVPTAEERALLGRLDPAHWHKAAEERGLAGTLTGVPELTAAGIVTAVRLDGQWTPGKLKAASDNVRALLGCRTDLRIEIAKGRRGGWAQLTLRTRSASDGLSLIWSPEHAGIGIDTVTGEVVDVPIMGTHKLVAGMTGMGKSVSWRPWMMRAAGDPCMAGILLDPKRQEARLWHGKIRTEGHQRGSQTEVYQAIYDTICELEREMERRQAVAEGTDWTGTPSGPVLLVVIEEGAAIVRMSKQKQWADVIDKLEALFTLARAVGMWVIWATQYPSKTNGGIPAQVSENIGSTLALTVESGTADRVIYGDKASETGWEPSKLGGQPGRSLVKHKNRAPNPVTMWHVTDDQVRALPDATAWRGPVAESGDPQLSLVKDAPTTVVDDVRAALAVGPLPQAEIVAATGRSKGAVSKALAALQDGGEVQRLDGGYLALTASGTLTLPTAGEVST